MALVIALASPPNSYAVTLTVGSTLQLQPIPSGGVKYTTDNCPCARVDKRGLVTALAEGEAVITARRRGLSAIVVVTVIPADPEPPPPITPTAVLTVEDMMTADEPVTFGTSGTTDDGTIVSAVFDPGDGTTPFAIPISIGLPQLSFQYQYAQAGTYSPRFTVTDNDGNVGSTQITFVLPPGPSVPPDPDPNQSPVANLTYLSGQYTGEVWQFSTVGSYDPENALASGSADYDDGSPPTTWGTTLPSTLSHSWGNAGTYTVTLTITDAGGLSTTSTLDVTVQTRPPVNQPPVAQLTRTQGNYVGDTWVFSTAGTLDADGVIASYVFDRGNGTSVSGAGLPATLSYVYPAAGNFTPTLTVTDSGGLTDSDAVTITVLAVIPPSGGQNAYFDSLVARPELYRAASLRDPAQLATKANGGYAYCNSCPLDIVYDVTLDMAKVTIGTTSNSLRNQLRIPIGTEDGHTYFTTWDVYYTTSYLPVTTLLVNHKAYQFAAASGTQVFEVRTRFDGGNKVDGTSGPVPGFNASTDICAIDARCYQPGPGTTKSQPMLPQAGTFILKPNRRVRFWVLITQTSGTDLVSLWVADSVTGPTQIQNNGAILIPASGIVEFWVELNTSTDAVAPGRGDMISYVANWVVLKDVAGGTIPSLLTPPQ